MNDYVLSFTGEFESDEGFRDELEDVISNTVESFGDSYRIFRKPRIKADADSDTEFRESFVDGAKGIYWSREEFEFKTNGKRDWKNSIRHQLTYFLAISNFEKDLEVQKVWEQILAWSSAFMIAEELLGEKPYYVDKVSAEEINQKEVQIKNLLDNRADFNRSKLFYGGNEFDAWTGFSLAYLVGKNLRELYCIDEFHTVEKDTVIEAIEEISG